MTDIPVPDVIGLEQTVAEKQITDAGFTVTVKTVSSGTTPEGRVLKVTPPPATSVPAGSSITLEVSSGPAQVAVPNVVDLEQSAAEKQIRDAGLTVTVTTASSLTAPKGRVIKMDPSPATAVAPGTAITLEVSSGPAQVVVPTIVGLTQPAAEAMLRHAGLLVGTVQTKRSNSVPSGGISSANPPPGTSVSQGSRVDVEVSTGPKTSWMTIIFSFLALVLLVAIMWGVGREAFLAQLADKEVARGLITFLIALTTVGLAIILGISTILLEDSPENDKRFDRGKQVLTMLLGVLGTIVGFYFGAATDTGNAGPQAQLAITTTALPAGVVNAPYAETKLETSGGTGKLTWSVEPALPSGLRLDEETGAISGTPTEPAAGKFTFTVTDSASPPVSKSTELTLEITPESK